MNTSLLLFLGDIGGSELILIMVVILIFFGANKIPELARGLGKGIREFKDASREIRSEIENSGQPTQQHYNAPAYQSPAQPTYPDTPTEPHPYVGPEPTIAPPMDGGITPPVTERPRPDQTTN
ncbi:Sec-independent protein translocase subunit TatA/TatB [Hymenobacter cavernae]|uniref:Sec-independent protein translocase protein TatA n=1 Tax=Hymenobacter cavernae TaxID=2044852 RepID=A0ABQ1TMQ2_9BACT|nr:twin-arginine translocase TatA/TatE family subunit [Hymenobacter cavernae]GGE98911.1 sec-independent protein translocase protein TatA [Hymenobacter cavernae]